MSQERKGFTVDSSGSAEEIRQPAPIEGEHSLPKSDNRRGILLRSSDRTEEMNPTGNIVTLEDRRQFYIDPDGKRVYDIQNDLWHEVGDQEDPHDLIEKLRTD